MFAKVFGQIFDSSIAEDYNCRRMFMDLLVLADSDGVVDMTIDAISRRTNVPIEEVQKYIEQLQQPDPASRSRLEEGKRIVKISDERDWGWQIVNYQHYRRIRDEEARRSYFRNAQRKHRHKLRKAKKQSVKDSVLTGFNKDEQVLTSASPSSSKSSSVRNRKPSSLEELLGYAKEQGISRTDGIGFFDSQEAGGWTRGGKPLHDWKASLRSWKSNGWLASQKQLKNGQHLSKPSNAYQARLDKEYREAMNDKTGSEKA